MPQQHIVIVEDDANFAGVLTDVLTISGYDVDARDSVFGAAALVREVHPVAVLLDLGLPYRPGTALLEELKADPATADVPVLVISGLTEALSNERRAQLSAVLSKPFRMSALLDALSRATGPEHRN